MPAVLHDDPLGTLLLHNHLLPVVTDDDGLGSVLLLDNELRLLNHVLRRDVLEHDGLRLVHLLGEYLLLLKTLALRAAGLGR